LHFLPWHLNHPPQLGKDVDMYEDFEGWTLSQLRERVELVQDFDKLCDEIVLAYIDIDLTPENWPIQNVKKFVKIRF
jgi:hypothetical protein